LVYHLLNKDKVGAAHPHRNINIFYKINFLAHKCGHKSVPLILLPLALSAFSHMWNPIGFPYFHGDEGHYIRRAMHVLEGFGPQEQRNTTWSFEQPYDHPYFGQLFLAAVLGTINYPELVNPKLGDVKTIETLHLAPRLIMGGLAVVDTFLIYKIAERRYSRKVAFFSAILFAVMPMSWLLRRILLDSLLLPFLLSSILFAIRSKHGNAIPPDNLAYKRPEDKISRNEDLLLTVSLSGIFLGFAIFTKISAIAFIPLILYLIYTKAMIISRNSKIILIGIWFLPVILIPSIWPGYAVLNDQFNEWANGISWQADRSRTSMWDSLLDLFRIDPVLFLAAMTGLVYAGLIRRDILTILWIIPFVIFFYVVGHVRYPYWIPIIPMLCITAANIIADLPKKISSEKARQLLSFGTLVLIGIFGLSTTIILLTTANVNTIFFELYALINENLAGPQEDNNSNKQEVKIGGTTLMGSNWMQTFSWIPKYVFNKDHDFKTFLREKNLPLDEEEKVILLVDNKDLGQFILSENSSKTFKQKDLYNDTHLLATFNKREVHYDISKYPYTSIHENPSLEKVEVRENY
jgi:4-amino-4-deoxy-L-arabinose transferase-like glycosyltransferase